MKEVRHVYFNLGLEGVETAQALLEEMGLTTASRLSSEGILAGSGSVTLPAKDPRLDKLIAELQKAGETPLVRAERRFTERDLASFEWLLLRINTPGLLGGFNVGQPYDRTSSCETCGAGSIAVPPLRADLRRMKGKVLDATSHDGHLVAEASLISAIDEAGLTGVEVRPVQSTKVGPTDADYRWLDIVSQWEPMAPASVLKTDDVCPTCARSGHYDEYDRVTELWYYEPPQESKDFNRTWEYFGTSYTYGPAGKVTVGGSRLIIVSQAVRVLFRRQRVRRISFEPVWFLSRHDAGNAV